MQENTNQSPYTYKEDHIVKNNYIDDSVTWESYINNIKINIVEHTEDKLIFDFINANAPLANALRRIMLSEIKTFAFHDLFITENTTVFSDEFLAQRIGLIPILYDKQDSSDLECVLDVTNTTKENMNVYSNHIINTFDELKIKKGVLICKLAPNHKLCIRMKISMGIGNYHAKWSPVALCSYRLMPEIKLKREFFDEDARKLKECLSEGVVELENVENTQDVENTQKVRAVIKNPRLEKMSREVLRHFTSEDLELGRVNNYFIFEVESIMEDPKVILRKAIEELKRKANTLLN